MKSLVHVDVTWCICLWAGLLLHTESSTVGSPVVLVPGDGGNQIEARLNRSSVRYWWCPKKSDWKKLFFSVMSLIPFLDECYMDNMRLVYDRKSGIPHDLPGVSTRVSGFGNTSSMEWLGRPHIDETSYFYPIVDHLVTKLGYERGRNIRGAPYDFRKAPAEPDFMRKLKKLIEDTYNQNEARPVVLIGHSMGNLLARHFLHGQTQAWKDRYIKSFVSLAGPYGGAVKILRLLISGDGLGMKNFHLLLMREMERSFLSTAWMMPEEEFWSPKENLVMTPARNYTSRDYKQLFKDIKFKDGILRRQSTKPFRQPLEAPGVEVHCLHGTNVSTISALRYEKGFPDTKPITVNGPGDGTVNLRSLLVCRRWRDKQQKPVYHREFPGSDHSQLLRDQDVIGYIEKVVLA